MEQEPRQRSFPVTESTRSLPGQLPLGFHLPDSARFENFVAGPNAELVRALSEAVGGGIDVSLFLWGEAGLGKTHLLQALCREAGNRDMACAYVPLSASGDMRPEMLAGMELLDLVCVDDIDAVAGNRDWEHVLFELFNRIQDSHSRLVVAATARPDRLGIILPDLVSRLAWGPVYPLRSLDDAGRLEALQLRARERGFELADDTGRYLLRRYPRDLPALCALLDRLDRASLVAKRRLTIPFVKAALED